MDLITVITEQLSCTWLVLFRVPMHACIYKIRHLVSVHIVKIWRVPWCLSLGFPATPSWWCCWASWKRWAERVWRGMKEQLDTSLQKYCILYRHRVRADTHTHTKLNLNNRQDSSQYLPLIYSFSHSFCHRQKVVFFNTADIFNYVWYIGWNLLVLATFKYKPTLVCWSRVNIGPWYLHYAYRWW